jgi:tripartite-type tricarboxylate transporter receptor subunit TctC
MAQGREGHRRESGLMALRGCLTLALLAGCAGNAGAAGDAYPSKPIRMIVAFPAGGVSDNLARLVGKKLSDAWGQQVVMDNRPGAGGAIGMELAAKSAPDGYTMAITSPGMLTISPSLARKPAYDPQKSFVPVSLLVTANQLLIATPSLPAQNVKELLALARAKPGQLNYASSGNGTIPHIAGEVFNTLAHVQIVHIPYKGSGPALTELIAGQVQIGFGPISTGLPQVRAGKLRALGVTGIKRSAAAPEVPTIAEAGVPGYNVTTWTAVIMPAGTPPAIVNGASREIQQLMRQPDVRDRLIAEGVDPVGSTPEELAALIKAELEKWPKLLKQTGINLDAVR